MKKRILCVFLLLFSYLLFFPEAALASAREGLLLWYRSIIPTLFPFMLLCTLAVRLNLAGSLLGLFARPVCRIFGCSRHGAFAVLTGFLCGFPMGAKVTADLARQQLISGREARFLYGFVNNVSPAFLLSYLASDQMRRPDLKVVFLGTILGSSLLYGILSSLRYRKPAPTRSFPPRTNRSPHEQSSSTHPNGSSNTQVFSTRPNKSSDKQDFSSRPNDSSDEQDLSAFSAAPHRPLSFALLDECITDTCQNTVRLGAYIMLFSILTGAAQRFFPTDHPAALFLVSSIEITNGVRLLASSTLPFPVKYVLLNAVCTFGGLSAFVQSVGIAGMDGAQARSYIKSRVCATLLCVMLSVGALLL